MPCLHCCSCNCSTSLFSGISLQSLCHHKVNTRAAEEIQSKQRLADKHMHTHMNTCMHYLHLIIGTSEDLPGGSLTHLYWSSYLCALHFLSIFYSFVFILTSVVLLFLCRGLVCFLSSSLSSQRLTSKALLVPCYYLALTRALFHLSCSFLQLCLSLQGADQRWPGGCLVSVKILCIWSPLWVGFVHLCALFTSFIQWVCSMCYAHRTFVR